MLTQKCVEGTYVSWIYYFIVRIVSMWDFEAICHAPAGVSNLCQIAYTPVSLWSLFNPEPTCTDTDTTAGSPKRY